MTDKANTPAQESAAWIPTTEGETLEGVLVEVVRAWSDARTNGGQNPGRGWYPLLRIRTADGTERDWHAFTTVAEGRVLDKQPLPGERIKVTYVGVSDKEPPKGQNAPKLWRLEIEGRDPATEARNVYADLGGRSRPQEPATPPPEPSGREQFGF